MKKAKVTIAVCLVLCFGLFVLTGFSFNNLGKVYTLEDYDKKEFFMDAREISKIQMDVESSNVEIISSDTDQIEITYYNMDKDSYAVTATGSEIIIQHNSEPNLSLLERVFGYSVPTKPLTINLPSTISLEFNATVSGGKITAAGFYSDSNLKIIADDADVSIADVSAEAITVDASYGNVELLNLKGTDNIIKITSEDADVSLTEISAESIFVDASYGDVKLANIMSRNFEFVTDSADVTLDKVSGENTNIKTEYGNVTGSFYGNANEYTVTITEDEEPTVTTGTGSKKINIELESGSCEIDFVE